MALGGGAIFNNQGKVAITNSTISFNSGSNGGALVSRGGAMQVVNTTMTGNSAVSKGGAIYNLNGNVSVSKSLLLRNVS